MQLTVIDTKGKNSTLEVLDSVFGVKPNNQLLAQSIRVYLSNQRQGTHKVKTRSDINRTKKKWFKQKGTGNARHGARTPNIFVGGGVAHGPNGLTDWSLTLSKAQRRKALLYAISTKASDILVSDEVAKIGAKTAEASKTLQTLVKNFKDIRVLIVLDKPATEILRSTQNIKNVLVTQVSRVNVYELLLADVILMSTDAVRELEKKATEVEKAEKIVKAATVVAKVVAKKTVKKPTVKSEKKVAKKDR